MVNPQRTLDQTMQEKVIVTANSGCDGLSELLRKRTKEVNDIEEELEKLQEDLRIIQEKDSTTRTRRDINVESN